MINFFIEKKIKRKKQKSELVNSILLILTCNSVNLILASSKNSLIFSVLIIFNFLKILNEYILLF